jgi:small subunit ribosomal protein S17
MAKKAIKVTIIKKSGDKSLMGEYVVLEKHPVYKKYIKVRRKYMIHDEQNKYKIGDIVFIQEHRPFSKKKSWVIVEDGQIKEDSQIKKEEK